MEKITMTKFEKLSNEEQLKMEGTIANGKFIGITEHNGRKWIQVEDSDTGEQILVSDDLEKKLEDIVFEQIRQELKNSPKKEFIKSFKFLVERFYTSKYVEDIMKSIPKDVLVVIYSQYSEKLLQAKIDIFKYIEPEDLYDEISKYIAYMDNTNEQSGKEEFSDKFIKKYINARDLCREELDRRIEQSGGIDNWINTNKDSKSKYKNFFAKTVILETMLNQNLSEEENEHYAKLLLNVGLTTQELAIMLQGGHLPLEAIAKMNAIKALKKIIAESVSRLDISNMLTVLLATGDETVLDNANWRQVTPVKLKEAVEKDPNLKATITSLFLVKMYKKTNRKFSEQEIDMIFESKKYDKLDILRAYFELAKENLCNDDKVIEAYKEVILDKLDKDEQRPKERVTIPQVSTGELLTLHTPDKVIEKISTYNRMLDDDVNISKIRFLAYYIRTIETHMEINEDETRLILGELKTKLQEGISNGDLEQLEVAIDLNKYGILADKDLKEMITLENEGMIFDLYEKGLEDNILLHLYKNRIITKNVISLIYDDQVSDNRIYEKIKNKQISKEYIITLLLNDVIDEEYFKDIKFEGLNWKNILNETEKEGLIMKMASLYSKGIISFEEIKALKESHAISSEEAEIILNQLDLDDILIKGLTSEEGKGEKRSSERKGISKRKDGIAIEDRDELLNSLGFEAVKNSKGDALVVARGSFKGYRVYRDIEKAYRVIVFENVGEGSSFIMHEAKAGEFIRAEDNEASLIGSRSEWREKARTLGSVTAKLHTNQWGNNVIDAIVEASSTFKFEEEKDRKDYIKQETKRLKEENKDLIEYISLLKKEERAK